MTRLIDADALMELIKDQDAEPRFGYIDANDIANAPTIEPSGDLISREEAKKQISEWATILTKPTMLDKDATMVVLDTLPSVSAEPKRGKWVWNEDGMDWGIGAWCCSECGRKSETWWACDKKYNPLRCADSHFCGNCGAKMGE